MTDSSAPRADTARRAQTMMCVWIPAVASLILSAFGAARVHLWRDEFATVGFGSLSLADLGHAVRHVDALLAPYYLVVHLWHSAGASGAALRVPSVLAAAGTVLLTAVLARTWWGNTAALVAGLTLTVNPLFAQLALDARPYALATFATVLATWVLERAVSRSTTGRWIGYWAALAAAGLLHAFAVLVAAAQVVLVLDRRPRIRPFVIAVAAALAVLAPLALLARGQTGQVGWIATPSPFRAVGTLGNVVDYQTSGRVTGSAVLFGAVVLAAAVLAVLRALRHRDDPPANARTALARIGFAIALLVGPWLVLLIASWLVVPVLATHYLAPSTVGVALLLGAGSAALADRLRDRLPARAAPITAGAITLVLAAVLVAPTTRVVTLRSTFQDDFAGLASALAQRVRPGDGLAVVQQFSQTGLALGVAYSTDDDAYLNTLIGRLPAGSQPLVDVRVITDVRPWRTEPRGARAVPRRVWVVATSSLSRPEIAAALARLGCAVPAPAGTDYGELVLSQISCSGVR